MVRAVKTVLAVVGIAVVAMIGLFAYSIHQEYYRYGENHSLSYGGDGTGMYQIGYDAYTYGRRQACTPPGAGIPGSQSCASIQSVACLSQRQLQARNLWPLKQIGDVPAGHRSRALYRPPQEVKPPALLVAHGACYQQYRLIK